MKPIEIKLIEISPNPIAQIQAHSIELWDWYKKLISTTFNFDIEIDGNVIIGTHKGLKLIYKLESVNLEN